MAQVPYSPVPTVEPQTGVPNDYQNIPARPDAFGASIAQGVQQAGAGTLKAAHFYNEVAADDATNRYMEGARTILSGDPNGIWKDENGQPILDANGQTQADRGFYGLQGDNALRARPRIEKALDDLRTKLGAGLSTPEQSLLFDQYTRRMQSYMSSDIGRHANNEANRWAGEVEQATATNHKTAIAEAALKGDWDEVNRHQQDLIGSYVRTASRLGGGNEMLTAARTKGEQQSLEAQINAVLPSNPALAKKLLDDPANTAKLAGLPGFDTMVNRVTNYADRQAGKDIARDIWNGGGSAGGFRAPPGAPIAGATPDEQMLLNEIRHRESGGDYSIQNREGSDASGGFQFRDETWREATAATGQGAQYAHAKDAPPAAQDANALWLLRSRGAQPWAASGPYAAHTIGGPSVRLASATTPSGGARQAPTREELINRIPDGLSDGAYNHAYTEVNKLYNHWEQATSSDRAQIKQSIRNGIPMLEDGRDFAYDPARIRSLLPPDQADQTIDLLEDAKAVGQQKIAVRGMSYPEAMAQSAANQAQLSKAPPAEYIKMSKMAAAFDKAADQHFKALFADPAGYLTANNPEIERLRQAVTAEQPDQSAALRAAGQPTAFEKYAAALGEEQDRLGVPKENQHVLGVAGAPKMAADIMANPSQAPTKIRQMEEGYGTAWPAVWNDLATLGKMPAGYQALGVLEEADAEQLARGMGAGKEGKAWDTLIGATVKNQLSTEVRGDEGVQKLLTSLRMEGASPTQIADFQGTISTLAFTKQMEGDTAAGANAAKAFTSLYSFMPNGGARVPAKQYEAVAANARDTLQKLTADNLTVPPGFGSGRPGMPNAEDYVRLIQAAPTWVNTQGDSLLLMSGAPLSRVVRDKAGNPITVRFDAAAPPPQPPAAGVGIGPGSVP